MSAKSKNYSKVLLTASNGSDVIDLLPVIKKIEYSGNTIITLGIDFNSWTELRHSKINYRTPAFYLDKSKCSAIDSEALRLAKSWFKPFESKIEYHGVNLGEMAEYDFIFLFMDALRSIEIAKSMIEIENPDEVWLTKRVPTSDPSYVRYGSLPLAINAAAKSRGLPVFYNNSNSSAGIRVEKSLLRNTASIVLNRIRKISLKTQSHADQCNIALIDVPEEISNSIERELKKIYHQYFIIRLTAPTLIDREKIEKNSSQEELYKELMDSELEQNLYYKDVSLVEVLKERFSRFFSYTYPLLISVINGTERFIKNARPKLVLTMCDTPPIYRTITKVCKMHHIQTLVIQHGATSGDMAGFHVMPIEADKQAVWGIISKEWAVKRGKPPETQVITGNPRYDSIVTGKKDEKEKLKVYSKLGIDRQKGIVIIATSWYAGVSSSYTPEEVEEFISKTLEAMKEFPEKQVVVKLHPGDFETYNEITKKIANELKIDIFITRHYLWELLDMCDLLITHSSTVGLEAMLLNKPVITFYSKEISPLIPYHTTESVVRVHESSNLISAIRSVLYDKKLQAELEKARRQFIYEYAYWQDGKASQRVANLIENMIKENSAENNHAC